MGYVRNAWYVAAWDHEVTDAPSAVGILGEPIVLWRGQDGIHAFEDRCVHRMAPLSSGRCEDGKLRCMYHGLLFDTDGACVSIPGQDKIPPQARVRTYPAVMRHSWVWIWMGDPALADPALIPPAVGLDHPDYILGCGKLDYAAEARLINDNLLDFSHLTYVHANSFQSGPEFADALPTIETIDRGIRYSRWVINQIPPQGRGGTEPTDNFMTYDFLIPGILLMQTGVFPLGTAEACAFGPPDIAQAVGATFTSQAVTPTGEGTARYFFSWGPHRNHGDEKLRDFLMDLGGKAFAEDKVMIEAQHRVIQRTAEPRIMPTAHDRAVTIFNRMVERMSLAEAA